MESRHRPVMHIALNSASDGLADAAIDAKLRGWNGETVQLSELRNDGPIVLMWYRGGWCP